MCRAVDCNPGVVGPLAEILNQGANLFGGVTEVAAIYSPVSDCVCDGRDEFGQLARSCNEQPVDSGVERIDCCVFHRVAAEHGELVEVVTEDDTVEAIVAAQSVHDYSRSRGRAVGVYRGNNDRPDHHNPDTRLDDPTKRSESRLEAGLV